MEFTIARAVAKNGLGGQPTENRESSVKDHGTFQQRLRRAYLDTYELTASDQAALTTVSSKEDTYSISTGSTTRVLHLEEYDPDLDIGYSENDKLLVYHHHR